MAWLSLHLPLSSLDLLILGLDFLLLCAIFVKLMDWALHGLSQAHQCGQEPQPTELETTLRASFFLSISWPVCMRHSEEGSVVHDLAISQVLPGAPRCSWAGLSEVLSFSWEHLDSGSNGLGGEQTTVTAFHSTRFHQFLCRPAINSRSTSGGWGT